MRLMKDEGLRLSVVLLAFLLALPLFAQNELGIFVNQAMFKDTTTDPKFGVIAFGPKFDSRVGYGISLNHYISPDMSIQLSGQMLRADMTEPDLRATFEVRQFAAMLQYYLNPRGTIVPYFGGGLAWMRSGVLNVAPGAGGGVPDGPIDVKDEMTWIAGAGVDLRLSRSVALALAGTYSPYRATLVGINIGTFRNPRINPVNVSAGLRLRF